MDFIEDDAIDIMYKKIENSIIHEINDKTMKKLNIIDSNYQNFNYIDILVLFQIKNYTKQPL